jgi:TRAP-type mannitol/chloroaromatic compound transport system substrate-binding protein
VIIERRRFLAKAGGAAAIAATVIADAPNVIVELLQFPTLVLRDLKKMATEVIRDQSEKSPMARKVHGAVTKFQAHLGTWDHVAEGTYHQFLKG